MGVISMSIWGQDTNKIGTTGNVGIGTTSPFNGLNNNGIHISKGQHSSLLLGLPFSGYGGIIQASDGRHRVFIGANLYDDQNDSWNNFQSGKGGAGISILADNGDWGSSISFMASNIEKSTVSRMYIKGNGKIGIGTSSPQNKLHIENGDLMEMPIKVITPGQFKLTTFAGAN